MTEQELIDTINALIDEARGVFTPTDIARRALDRCGGLFEHEAVADLADQILSARCEPWKWPSGTRPRLKGWKDGISRLTPKPSVMEILHAGWQAKEPLDARLARVRRAYPKLTDAAILVEMEAHLDWLQRGAEQQMAEAEKLKRLMEIVKPATDEDPSLTMGEAVKVMAARGCEEAQRVIEA